MYRRDVFWLYYILITPYLHYWDYDMDLYQLWTTFDWVMDCFSFPSLPSLGLVDGAGSTAGFRFLAFARNWLARASAIYMGKRIYKNAWYRKTKAFWPSALTFRICWFVDFIYMLLLGIHLTQPCLGLTLRLEHPCCIQKWTMEFFWTTLSCNRLLDRGQTKDP